LKPYGFAFTGALVVETDGLSGIRRDHPGRLRLWELSITRDIQGLASFFPADHSDQRCPDPAARAVAIG